MSASMSGLPESGHGWPILWVHALKPRSAGAPTNVPADLLEAVVHSRAKRHRLSAFGVPCAARQRGDQTTAGMSESGTSRQFAATQHFGRFRSEADEADEADID